ncbi:PREDICTED: leukotriene A-4 hydrolase isoform X2 [Nicrophorus vespilloides]|uniref:Leukotriene A-4 hydrolase isoform X2 n=1 Tax=Nicrophorus vespilloides TaxID=110193 RepID=A0ABM1MG20_NICVS|nr:PREDICTED: leukotriene A-4 hydrolase isoform X2 [Nicrophorus vespilloides]
MRILKLFDVARNVSNCVIRRNFVRNFEPFINMWRILILSNCFLLILAGDGGTRMARFSPIDPSSFSRPDLAVVTNIKLSLKVHFDQKIFSGNCDLTVKKLHENVNEVVLDVKDLDIESIYETETNTKCKYTLSQPVGEFGSELAIEIPPKEVNNYIFTINYKTRPHASGLQWLEPEQTAGKKHPYVFSQFQAIHARSFLPCQDTPYVKTKYEALINAPTDLSVVMSAIRDATKPMIGYNLHHFKQDVPIQSYLIAIAIGALESRKIGPRSTVWAEKEFIEMAANEFANTEKQLKTAEDICGPYVWGIYDLLVLPPSFPFGGMENPCLTFVTPTLLAGDRSLANVVAHEIAHSWTGNLVTNANFEHFWLNEGFTVFIERKILGRLESPQVQDFDAYGGTVELKEAINELGDSNPLTCLVVNLTGVHPDDAFSTVPYEKGQTFLRYLETIVEGPAVFEPFLRKYFDTYKYRSLTTDEFKAFFIEYFSSTPEIKNIEWNKWLHTPGMPPVIPDYDKTLLKTIDEMKQRWLNWDEKSGPVPFSGDEITSIQKIQLLQDIFESEPQPIKKLEVLEEKFKFTEVQNAEIKFRWLRIGIKAKWEKIVDPALNWVNEVGRMKYCRPLYRDFYNWEEMRAKAIQNFQDNRKNMMHVSAYTIAHDLRLKE